MVKVKKTMAILLAVCFLASITAAAVSASSQNWNGKWSGDWEKYNNKDFKKWNEDDTYKWRGHTYYGHYDNYGNFWHKHGHYNMRDGKKYFNNHMHRFNMDHGFEDKKY